MESPLPSLRSSQKVAATSKAFALWSGKGGLVITWSHGPKTYRLGVAVLAKPWEGRSHGFVACGETTGEISIVVDPVCAASDGGALAISVFRRQKVVVMGIELKRRTTLFRYKCRAGDRAHANRAFLDFAT